jgi:hypothetical protein
MRVSNYKRINKDDFEPQLQDAIEKIAFCVNPFAEQVIQAFNKNIGFDNLNQEIVSFEVEVDANGKPKNRLDVKSNLNSKVNGYLIIRVESINHNDTPNAVPLIYFTTPESGVTIQMVKGLPANKKFRITAIAIG